MELALIITILGIAISAVITLIIIASLISSALRERPCVNDGSLNCETTIRLSPSDRDNEEHCLRAAA